MKEEEEFEKYQTFYCYQWKVNHIQMHKKIVELEGEARILKEEQEKAARQEYINKVRLHDQLQATIIMDDFESFKTNFFREVSCDEKTQF